MLCALRCKFLYINRWNFLKLMHDNQIFRNDFVCNSYHLSKISAQIIECINGEKNPVYVLLYVNLLWLHCSLLSATLNGFSQYCTWLNSSMNDFFFSSLTFTSLLGLKSRGDRFWDMCVRLGDLRKSVHHQSVRPSDRRDDVPSYSFPCQLRVRPLRKNEGFIQKQYCSVFIKTTFGSFSSQQCWLNEQYL